eukprot:1596126-Pyramimonas_sp.AAC.1
MSCSIHSLTFGLTTAEHGPRGPRDGLEKLQMTSKAALQRPKNAQKAPEDARNALEFDYDRNAIEFDYTQKTKDFDTKR